MSAYTRAYVSCDHYDETAKPGWRICGAVVEDRDRDGAPAWTTTKAEARREAKRRGWLVRIHLSGKPGGDFDYCPEHKAAHQPAPKGDDGGQ